MNPPNKLREKNIELKLQADAAFSTAKKYRKQALRTARQLKDAENTAEALRAALHTATDKSEELVRELEHAQRREKQFIADLKAAAKALVEAEEQAAHAKEALSLKTFEELVNAAHMLGVKEVLEPRDPQRLHMGYQRGADLRLSQDMLKARAAVLSIANSLGVRTAGVPFDRVYADAEAKARRLSEMFPSQTTGADDAAQSTHG